MGSDLVKSDSVMYPLVGVATYSIFVTMEAESYISTTDTKYTIRFGFADGRWKVIKIDSRIDSDMSVPPHESKVGRQAELSPEWLNEAMALVRQ